MRRKSATRRSLLCLAGSTRYFNMCAPTPSNVGKVVRNNFPPLGKWIFLSRFSSQFCTWARADWSDLLLFICPQKNKHQFEAQSRENCFDSHKRGGKKCEVVNGKAVDGARLLCNRAAYSARSINFSKFSFSPTKERTRRKKRSLRHSTATEEEKNNEEERGTFEMENSSLITSCADSNPQWFA